MFRGAVFSGHDVDRFNHVNTGYKYGRQLRRKHYQLINRHKHLRHLYRMALILQL